ncbi:MAG: NADPH:quinone reductase [Pirellulales bacterium]
MKAAFIERIGPPEVIQYGDLPDPQPGPGQVLVKVRACAVNPIDTYVRAGTVVMPLAFPFVVGCDLAGEVVAVGPGVTTLAVGDRVWGSNQGVLGRQGTFAELAAVDAQWLYPTPAGVSDRDAVAAALVGITAWLGLVPHAALKSGETIAVSGASGAVGSMVVQMAKLLGARVIGVAGTDPGLARVAALGADAVVDRRGGVDAVAAQVKAVAPAGVNVWWEALREPDFDTAIGLLADEGRMVLMAGRDARPPFPVGPFYVKQAKLLGFVMFKAAAELQATAARDINGWLASGGLRPPMSAIMPLTESATAHRLQEEATIGRAGPLTGKIIVEP